MLKITRLLFILAIFVPAGSMAFGKIVYDPTNFTKNLITSQESIKQTAIAAAQQQTLIDQYMVALQNVRQLDPQLVNYGITRGMIPAGTNYGSVQDVINAANGTYGSIGGVIKAMSGMDAVYKQLDKVHGDVQRTSIYANSTPEKVIQYEFDRARAGEDSTDNYYNSIRYLNQQLDTYQQRSDRLSKSIPDQNGIVEMLQLMASQNSVTQDMLAHLIQVSTSQSLNQMESQKNNYQDRQDIERRRNAGNEIENGITNALRQGQ